MLRRTRSLVLVVLLCLTLTATVAAQDDRSYSADSFDVDVEAQTDRSLLVEERVTFRFVGGPFSFVFRELPTDHTDGITNIVAGADGMPWPEGTGPGQVEIEDGDPIVVTWHLSPTSDTVQTFTLSYRALGVVRRVVSGGEEADVLDWQALPDEYEYDIASSRVEVSFPAEAQLVGEPEVLVGKAEATVDGNTAIFTQGNLSSGDPLVVRLSFAPGVFNPTPPAWQAQREAQNSRAWMWLTAAGVTLVGGLLAIWAATRGHQDTIRRASSFLHKPPVELPPALAGWLFNQTISWQHGLGTLLDLAGRGLVRIDQMEEGKWYRSAEFDVTLLDRPSDLRPHERALLDILFSERDGTPRDTLAMSEMGKLITSSRWKQYTEALEDDARTLGWISDEAQERGKRLVGWGIALMLMIIPIGLVTILLYGNFGLWPLTLGAAVILVGLIATIVGATVSPLSNRATQVATQYDPFRRFLEEVAKGKMEMPDPAYYEAYLPYATVFGRAEPFLKDQAKRGYNTVPSYFQALNADDGASFLPVYIAAIVAANNSGGAAAATAGAAGAAAAGGGASGAG